jgi:macrodomain Ter protein organizer (MatP/YcbG family)
MIEHKMVRVQVSTWRKLRLMAFNNEQTLTMAIDDLIAEHEARTQAQNTKKPDTTKAMSG